MLKSKITNIAETKSPKDKINKISDFFSTSLIIWLACLCISALFLFICSKSSPLYPFNDWVDANSFFTMGKGMMHGRIPYRDLFEQKGVLLYFLHGIAYLLSNKTFFGVYVLEVISFSIFLFYSFKLAALFIDKKYTIVSLPILAASILNLKSFSNGDSAEEFCLPLLMIGLYYLIKYFKDLYPKQIPYRWLLLNGILAGCVLWIKFSMLGFWFAWMGSIFFCLLASKLYRQALISCVVFLSGMLIASLPWFIYFGINNSISDWFYSYFVFNAKFYSTSNSILSNIKSIFNHFLYQAYKNPFFCSLLLLGVTVFVTTKKFLKKIEHRLCLLFCVLCLSVTVYGGGKSFVYYFLIFSPFVVFGFIFLLDFYFNEFGPLETNNKITSFVIITFLLSILFSLQYNQNINTLKVKKEDLVQYKFASIINQTENATLLNYDALDFGIFTTTGITPNIKYFFTTNADYAIQKEEQDRYIKEKITEFIVTRRPASDNIERLRNDVPYLYKNYFLIDTEKQINGDIEFNYFLFKKIR